MSAYVIDSQLFRDQFSTQQARDIFSDQQTVQRWLDVEAALAKVHAKHGIIPQKAADEICAKARVELVDLDELKKEMDRTSHPIVPLLRAMKKVCTGDAAEFIHWGATTQDIIDTGTVLQIRDILNVIEKRYNELLVNLETLARKHRDLVMVARSHGQQALPITFGFKVAVWIEEMRRNLERFNEMKGRILVGQYSGGVGTLSVLGENGMTVQQDVFKELGLKCPKIHWHVSRDTNAELACVLSICTSTIGKIAHEIYCLQKTETAELEEPFSPGKVGSSTMPHKRNPPTCETIVALSRVVRSIVPLAIEAMNTEHERDKIALQTEREYITRLCCMADAAAAKIVYVTAGLSVRSQNMEKNLFTQRGLLMSEAVMMKLSDEFGRQEAHDMVYEICMKVFESEGEFKEGLLGNPDIAARFSPDDIDKMLNPRSYTGLAGKFVDQVLANK
jgi:3-carboxy-cis,cis-muconate cycloisomerase